MKQAPTDFKDELLYGLKAVRESILAEALALPPGACERVFLGTWTVMDLLAHLAGWDHTNLQAAHDVLDGLLPEFYEQHDRDWQTYNAALVAKYKRSSLREQVDLVRRSQKQLMDELQTIPAEDLKRDTGVRARGIKVTIARLLQAELEDETTHFEQIYEFRKSL
jgi:hypothetical protein